MLLVIAGILLTSPLMTALRDGAADAATVNPERFLFELGGQFGPGALKVAIVLTAATLLMGAANTAIIGCYHVFLALVRLGYMPAWLAERSRRFNTPHRAIAISVLVPVLVIVGSRAASIDAARRALRLRASGSVHLDLGGAGPHPLARAQAVGVGFYLGLFTSALIVDLVVREHLHKKMATIFGGSVTLVGFALAYSVRRGWIGSPRKGFVSAEAAETAGGRLETRSTS